jgi:hypothetical protein
MFRVILPPADREAVVTMLIDMHELPATLRAQIAVLRGLVHGALQDFLTKHRDLRVDYTVRTEASIIHDYMVREAKVSGFPWKWRRNLFLFRVGQDYSVKPKKLDRHLRPRSIQTQLVLEFERQRVMRMFDDLDLTHLYLGYQIGGAELVTSSIWLVCPDGKRVRWAAELRAEDATASVQVAMPAEPTLPVEPTVRRVTPKRVAKKDVKTEAAGE